MNIEDLFIDVCDLINEVPEIKWVDLDFGQMDSETRPAVLFPCALVSIDLPNTNDVGNKVQKPQVIINVKLCFNYNGETSTGTPPVSRARALEYYGLVKSVYKKLQGARIGTGALKRRAQVESARPDKIKIVDMPFETFFLDNSANE